jgi:chemotaxis protein MotB
MSKLLRIERRKSRQVGQEWLTIYSDLMTNLMLFFLMLFALTRLDTTDKTKVYQSFQKSFTTIQEKARFRKVIHVEKKAEEDITEMVAQLDGMSDVAKINVSEQYIKMRLPSPVLFDPGKHILKDEGKRVLSQIADILKPLIHEVVVEGHSDMQALSQKSKYFSNWELSGARALNAINHLVLLGIDPKRLSAVAYGPYHPLYPNDTEENRTKNRRIEINIIREK